MRIASLSIVLAAFAACAPLASSGRARAPASASPRAADPTAAPWVMRDLGMRRSQISEWRTLVTSQADTFVRVDTLAGDYEVAWSAVPNTSPARVAGLFSQHRIARGADSLAPLPGLSVPFSFTAEYRAEASQPTFVIPDAATCDSPIAAAVQSMRDLWMPLPDTLRPGTSWEDSSRYTVCRDGVSIEFRTTRRFSASAARLRDGDLVVLVARQSRTSLVGAGRQFGDSVTVSGDGEGTASLEVSLRGGVIVAGEGTSELRVDFRGSRRAQRVVQETRLTIRAP